jgi:hypothetical protein
MRQKNGKCSVFCNAAAGAFCFGLELKTKFLDCYFDANLESEPGDIMPELTSSA